MCGVRNLAVVRARGVTCARVGIGGSGGVVLLSVGVRLGVGAVSLAYLLAKLV